MIPNCATWFGGFERDLNVVSSLESTTLRAFSASRTWGSAYLRISYAFLLSNSILALSTSSYFFLATAAFWSLSVF